MGLVSLIRPMSPAKGKTTDHKVRGDMRIWKVLPILFFLVGCSGLAGNSNPSTGPVPLVTPVKLTNGPFALTVFSPADQAVVPQPKVELRGEVSEDAVLTVNADTYVLNAGAFTETILLAEGLNSIQIVASDMAGNEIDLVLTLTYQP